MDEELKKMTRENLRLSRENNEMLSKLFRAHKRARFWNTVRALLTIAAFFVGYYLLIPYLESISETYQNTMDGIEKIQEAKDAFGF